MSSSLRRRIFLGTTGVTALSLILASLSVWLTAKTMLYRQLDHVLIEHKNFFVDDHRAARPPQPPPGGAASEAGGPPQAPPAPPGPPGPGFGPGGPGPAGEEPGRPGERRGADGMRTDQQPGRGVFHGHLPAEMAGVTGSVWVEIIDAESGRQVARSPSLGADEHLVVPSAATGSPGRVPSASQAGSDASVLAVAIPDVITDAELDGKEVRCLVYADDHYLRLPPFLLLAKAYATYQPGDANDPHLGRHLIAIACDASLVHKDLLHIRMVLISVCFGALLMAMMATLWLQKTLLRPIERISRGIEGLSPDNLSARVAVAGVPDEMSVVVTRLNELLGRVEVAFKHEKQTIANIAHELRTPVAGLKTTLEVTMDGTGVEELREGISRALSVADSMQSTIANLLTLARLESGVVRLDRSPVDVTVALRHGWDAVAQRAASRSLSMSWQLPESLPLQAWCAPQMLTQILGNLFDNVVAYAQPSSVVAVQVERQGEQLVVTIANHTDGTVVDFAHVFDAFYRASDARTAGTHCGLGLALVRRMVGLHGGVVTAWRDAEQRFAVTLQLAVPPHGVV